MNTARMYEQLSRGVVSAYEEYGIEGHSFTLEDAALAVDSALLGYSRFMPALRRLGTGVLVNPLVPGETRMLVVGGMFEAGETLLVDALSSRAEPVTVRDVDVMADDADERQRVPCLQIELTEGVINRHRPSTFIAAPAYGLQLRAGIDTYLLPPDWIEVDEESFDLATGMRHISARGNRCCEGGDGESLVPLMVGYGRAMSTTKGTCMGQTRYLFHEESPACLTLFPPPAADGRLDFSYLGHHTLETVPEIHREALIAYAMYAALSVHASRVAGREDRMAGDEKVLYSKSREGLAAQASESLARFHRLIVNRPCTYGG